MSIQNLTESQYADFIVNRTDKSRSQANNQARRTFEIQGGAYLDNGDIKFGLPPQSATAGTKDSSTPAGSAGPKPGGVHVIQI